MSEVVEIISAEPEVSYRWQPAVGPETLALLNHIDVPETDKQQLREEAVAVLSRCLPPPPEVIQGRETGLVIGYVQSGKTMSFTTVAALARDNGYRLIIAITGTTVPLFNQSCDRLKDDLRLRERSDRKWHVLNNPKPNPETLERIRAAIYWDDAPGATKQAVLLAVMKNGSRLDALTRVLEGLDLQGVPALIIDDEADQASLNNQVQKGKESPTYRRIVRLRELLHHHTFLEYTATPQAPLLINLIDVLSPGFAELLSPGLAYTGGKTFFESDFGLVETIPLHEIPSKDQPLPEPPDSLLEAMRIFFLGVAIASMGQEPRGNRSMMVHPSKETMQHANYAFWVRLIKQQWEKTLVAPEGDPTWYELIDDFRPAYQELANTVDDLPSFDAVIPYLRSAIRQTLVTEFNAARGKTPQPDWEQVYAHILVGGEALNRGVTVKGLTVTYMPRGKGVGNADTVQQRARWFGYKANYIGYCRVYLDEETLEIYRAYVEHEESIRKQLKSHKETGRALKEWRRAFFLSGELRPTRNNVIDIDYVQGGFSDKWLSPSAPHDNESAIQSNCKLVSAFLNALNLQPASRYQTQGHEIATKLSLDWVYRQLLTQYQVTRLKDSQQFTGALLQLAEHLEQNPDDTCAVYYMSGGISRERNLNENDEIDQLFQGRSSNYPGDREVRETSGVTVQIHIVSPTRGKLVIAKNVPAIAVWIPKELGADWLVQDQGGPDHN